MKRLSIYAVIFFMLGSMMFSRSEQPESQAWSLLQEMLLIPGVSGQESRVADFVFSSIPMTLNPNRDEMENV